MKNSILKIFCIFLFVCFSLHIFVLDLKIVFLDSFSGLDNAFYIFYLSLWRSMRTFDVIWLIAGIFLFDFFYDIYFVEGVWKVNRLIIILVSVIISSLILVFYSLYTYHNLKMLFFSFVQIYKCLMVGVGYYFIMYAFFKRLFFLKKIQC